MILFIANGSEVQLSAAMWRVVAQSMLRQRRADLAYWNKVLASVKGVEDFTQVRISLEPDMIERVREIVGNS